MFQSFRLLGTTARAFILLTIVLGVLFPLAMYGVGRAMPNQTDGSWLVDSSGNKVGSAIIGQEFTDPKLFYGRPSENAYDAMNSGASNVSPADAEFQQTVAQRRADIARREQAPEAAVPNDAVTASGSGLDPHISHAYALLQAPRVARENGISQEQVRQLIDRFTGQRLNGGGDGAPVNVVRLNHALVTEVQQ